MSRAIDRLTRLADEYKADAIGYARHGRILQSLGCKSRAETIETLIADADLLAQVAEAVNESAETPVETSPFIRDRGESR